MSTPSTPKESKYRSLGQLDRPSLSDSVADSLRSLILSGEILPGERLSEPDIIDVLSISRNTLREAFRILIKERLAVHELNRGVFVRKPTSVEVAGIFDCRRLVEGSTLRSGAEHIGAAMGGKAADQSTLPPPLHARLAALTTAIATAKTAARKRNWSAVVDANIDFHKAIVALGGSDRLTELMTNIWHESRLIQNLIPKELAGEFAVDFMRLNKDINTAIQALDFVAAEKQLDYALTHVEHLILEEFARD